MRSFDAVDARVIEGTDGAAYPFWSPDSRSVGFFSAGRLKVVSLDGSRLRELCDALRRDGWHVECRGCHPVRVSSEPRHRAGLGERRPAHGGHDPETPRRASAGMGSVRFCLTAAGFSTGARPTKAAR